MDGQELEAAANFLYHWVATLWRGRRKGGSVSNDNHALWRNTLCNDPVAHVVAEHHHARGSPQGAAMHFLPAVNPEARIYDLPAHRHIRVQIADVIHKRPPRHPRDKCSGDTRHR